MLQETPVARAKRIGMLTPSSNIVLEPMVARILSAVPAVTAHVARLRVTQISLGEDSQKQFQKQRFLDAAEQLADAKVDVIGWNGTSASWNGFEKDEQLCAEISAHSQVQATSAVLAINELLGAFQAKDIALVTPYVDAVQTQIASVYAQSGYRCVAERHFGETVNFAFAEIGDDVIAPAIREVAKARPQAIIIMCTNLAAAHLADDLEAELGIPIIDSVSAFVWKALRLCDVDTRPIRGWGRLFDVQ